MGNYTTETYQQRDRWIAENLKERGWSENEIKRGERYRKWEEYIVVGVLWSLLIIPAPLGLLLIIYGGYLRFRYRDLGERYVRERRELNWEFYRRGSDKSREEWLAEERQQATPFSLPDRS